MDVEARDALLGLGKGLGCQIVCLTADLKTNRPQNSISAIALASNFQPCVELDQAKGAE